MASEVKTTVTTEAGLQERAQARLTSKILYQSKLLGAGSFESLANASSAQFPIFPAPDPTQVTQITEGDRPAGSLGTASGTLKTVTIAAASVTLLAFSQVTSQSKVSLRGGQGVGNATLNKLAGDVAAKVDSYIASKFTVASFTTLGSGGFVGEGSVVTYNAFLNAKTSLLNSGYNGTIRACMSHYMANKIRQDMKTAFFMDVNNRLSNSGYLGTLDDVEIYAMPSSWMSTQTINSQTRVAGLMWVDGFGFGTTYDDTGEYGGLVEISQVPLHVDVEIGATAYMNAVALSATGGIILGSDSATL